MAAPRRAWLAGAFALALIAPLVAPNDYWIGVMARICLYTTLALGLNIVVGFAGLLDLGYVAFFGIGSYLYAFLASPHFGLHLPFLVVLPIVVLGTALSGILIGAPTLRLRGDYLAIVTLGFGEVVKFAIKNLENITNGSKALNPLPDPWTPGNALDWTNNYRGYYYLALGSLVAVVLLLRNLESSKLGRAWMAIREDELAASCMGINAAMVKLSAFAVGAALAGLAGSIYAVSLDQTGGPDSYTFNRSINVLCFLIIGGMGNIRGAIVGTFVLMGYDNILTPAIDDAIQRSGTAFRFSNVKLVVFGLALILMMRFRPQGIFPTRRERGEAGGGA